ncbi:hypothetical protein BDV39DRAFT_199861 [Aspergillus sergii]|uniref:Uncharacterized protein n=1 Tax=Aspergillus sergii TaxID=1034303 RepID=A0A5N6XL65_9EURO|nr:hypothetical protein BDV39DRAFT_199861 [Aspergillus sergii]
MKFISVVALLAPVVLAAPQARDDAGWISLIKEKCPNISEQCIDIAKKVHQPLFGVAEAPQATPLMPECSPAYVECIQNITPDYDVPYPDATGLALTTCLLQIAPDHFRYFLDNESAEIPIPRNQNCALRELHRVVHIELGHLA